MPEAPGELPRLVIARLAERRIGLTLPAVFLIPDGLSMSDQKDPNPLSFP